MTDTWFRTPPIRASADDDRSDEAEDEAMEIAQSTARAVDHQALEFISGAALVAFDADDLRIVSWNAAAEQLTGISAETALGSRCWEVLGGRDDEGAIVCSPACPYARLARRGRPVPCHRLVLETPEGPRRTSLSTILVEDTQRPLILHVMCKIATDLPPPAVSGGNENRRALTARQYDVLHLLAEGVPAKGIASRLHLSLATVRNHIRAILFALNAHSQLEALAEARRRGII